MNLFKIDFYEGSYKDALLNSISTKRGYSCFVNAHMLYEHHKNLEFNGVLSNSLYNFLDGMPLVYAIRFLKKKKQERIAGNDIIFSLVEKAKKDSLRIFIFGSTKEILNRISKKLMSKGVIHKSYYPPFAPIDEFNLDEQANVINNFKPDMVWVGLGCPKQEIWMYRMKDIIKAPMYGLGGAFNLYAGVDTRAPKFMRDIGLEWIYRLALEPKRLFKRYLITNTFFIYLFGKELLKRVFRRS